VSRIAAALLTLALLAGCGDDRGGDDRGETTSTAPPTTSTTSTTSTSVPTTTTDPAPQPLPGGTLEVLVVGDSVMHDASAAIEAALTATGGATVRPASVFGLGFSELAGIPFAEGADDLLAGPPVDQVVVMVGSWDHLAVLRDADGYADDVRTALDALAADGRSVLLLGEPPSAPDKGEEPSRRAVNEILEEAAAEVPRTRYLDTGPVIGDARGRYVRAGPDGLLRKPDGRHLCPSGAARFGVAVLEALDEVWELPPADPAWALGEWRQDRRYDDPPGGCLEG